MTDVVRNAHEFECLMKKRAERIGAGEGGKLIPVKCTADGKPDGQRAKRAMCEAQKLSLGCGNTYMKCGVVEKYFPATCSERYRKLCEVQGIAEGDTYFDVIIIYESMADVLRGKLYDKLIFGEVIEAEDGTSSCLSPTGSFCAYPGGCD